MPNTVALDLIRALRPVVAQLRKHSPEAADQVERAELVNRFVCTGDTSGDEAGTKTGVRVFWKRHHGRADSRPLREPLRRQQRRCWCDSAFTTLGACCTDKCTVCGGC